jgi:hypothetical protein
MLGITLGEHVLLLGLEHRELLDLGEIAIEPRLAAEGRDRRNSGVRITHFDLPFFVGQPFQTLYKASGLAATKGFD